MKKLLILILFPFTAAAQLNGSITVGFTQNMPAGGFTMGYQIKRLQVEYAQLVPLSNLSSKKPLYLPRIGYSFGNFTPYISYAGGGLKTQVGHTVLDIGMIEKHPYISISYSSLFKAHEKINNNFAVLALSFISGLANGSREAMQHHWPEVHRKYPNLNAQYWNPAISWTNKNRNKFTKAIPTFTDGYHLLQFLERAPLVLAVAISINEKPNIKKILVKSAKVYAANRVGHYLSYNLIF